MSEASSQNHCACFLPLCVLHVAVDVKFPAKKERERGRRPELGRDLWGLSSVPPRRAVAKGFPDSPEKGVCEDTNVSRLLIPQRQSPRRSLVQTAC